MDDLEPRALLSMTSPLAYPTFEARPLQSGGGPSAPYTPAEIQQAYGFNNIRFSNGATFSNNGATGSGQTIAIVDAYDDPNIQTDLNTFDTNNMWGLPATTVTRVDQTGGTSYPARDSSGGWELEESLDVEWAHAMAPGASILLVEASSASYSDLLTAVNYAASHASVVSMSWAGSEVSGEANYDAYFSHSGVAFVASSGDSGAPALYPSASPNVLSVGGTSLTLGAGNVWSSETGWSGSGGGPSTQESQPSYQKLVVKQQSSARATPDVAYDADPNTGVYVYDSVPYNGSYGWWEVGGTSAAAPQWSALLAIADQGRVLNGLSALNTSPQQQQVMSILYANPADFHDITSGTSTGSPNYSAGTGYDYVTGMGSPIANLVVGSLVGTSTASSDKLVVTGPTAETAGTSFSLTVTAQNSSGTATDTSYLGMIHFTSSDVQAGLPANYPFTAADHGTHTFTVTLKTAGSQSITATDTSTSAITGTLSPISVSPASASQLVLSGLPSNATVGVAQGFTVTAEDPYGNVATAGYTGTVHFTSSDPGASLPANSTLNQGVKSFSVTFGTAGTRSVTVTDTTSGITVTQSGITVAPAAPTLTASVASSTQINLAWTGSSGATGYLVQQSLSSSTGWNQVGSTSGGTTSFQDMGLTAGTTYYFRVIATVGSINSASSNVASATTTGTAPTADSIWPNSYVPSVNAYSSGAYELGVKFTASVAGYVTGVRFYKESGMSGQNVGHLWSSRTLLATATFTNESSSGWQQVNFSSSSWVQITANTVYVASFSTSAGYFYITTGYFTSGGHTNGPLYAEPNSVGDGVYNRAGAFPYVSGNGMNFWADVAFTPSSSGAARPALSSRGAQSIAPAGFRSGSSTTDPSSRLGVLAPPATPAGPARSVVGWRRTMPSTLSSVSYRRPITQAATVASGIKKSSSAFGSL